MKSYRAVRTFVHENLRWEAGAEGNLTDAQAAFLVPSGVVELVEAPAAAEGGEQQQPKSEGADEGEQQ